MVMGLKRGRPSKGIQLAIERKLRPYYEQGITATFAATKTGFNPKTVGKYYHHWTEQIRQTEGEDFLARQKREREQIKLSYDSLILEEYELLFEIKQEIQKYKKDKKPMPQYLPSTADKTVKTISYLIEKKEASTMQHMPNKSTKEIEIEDIDETLMKNIVRHLALEKEGVTPSTLYSVDDVMHEIIKLLKCDDRRARGILGKMKELGLTRCRENQFIDSDAINKYSLLNFALMRNYVKEKEIKYMKK